MKHIICEDCRNIQPEYKWGLCKECYEKLVIKEKAEKDRHYIEKKASINNNRFGKPAGEIILTTMCESVKLPTESGYDFLCDGMKISIKKSSMRKDGSFTFQIMKNKVPDHFLFLGFETNDTLPDKIWLIDGYRINDKGAIRIVKTTKKWEKDELSIEKIMDRYCEKIND